MVRPARQLGRPPRVDRAAIARAALEIGLDQVTIKQVAERLGMSVPGLYYYVRGREGLLALAAEHSLAEMELPEDRGQHWAEWLREWARHTRNAVISRPELLPLYTAGAIPAERVVEATGRALDGLHRSGFSPEEALEAFRTVSAFALGSAVEDIRATQDAEAGSPWIAQVHSALARRRPDEVTTLRKLVAAGDAPEPEQVFEERLTTVLAGVAARRGTPVEEVEKPPGTKRRGRRTRSQRQRERP
jgi:AcrR family transcriptional regulator